jgi:LysM repeat protein
VARVVVIAVVVAGSLGGDEGTGGGDGRTPSGEQARNGPNGGGEPTPREYVVESGDSLSSIAERFDISVRRIERLNPDVDPQALGEGQTLQLRRGGGGN